MAGAGAAKARRKANAADERLFDRELEELPPELRWREWMMRVEAVIFASAEPVSRRRWRGSWEKTAASIC